MLLNRLVGLVFAGALVVGVAAADVVVRIAPPRMVIQKRGHPPSRNHVWVQGYHNYDGRGYVWVPGRWEQRPRPRAHWVAHRWVHQRGGWVFVEGHWR